MSVLGVWGGLSVLVLLGSTAARCLFVRPRRQAHAARVLAVGLVSITVCFTIWMLVLVIKDDLRFLCIAGILVGLFGTDCAVILARLIWSSPMPDPNDFAPSRCTTHPHSATVDCAGAGWGYRRLAGTPPSRSAKRDRLLPQGRRVEDARLPSPRADDRT